MYLNIDGYNKIQDRLDARQQQEFENQRRMEADKRAAAIFARQQQQWGDEDALKQTVRDQAAGMMGANPNGGVNPTAAALPSVGVPTAPVMPNRKAVDDMGMGDAAPAAAPVGMTPPAQPPAWQAALQDQMGQARNLAALAHASGNLELLSKARDMYFETRKRQVALQMADQLDNMTSEQRAELVKGIPNGGTNKVRATVDDRGYVKLTMEDGSKSTMPWPDFKNYLISKALGNIEGMHAAEQAAHARTNQDNAALASLAHSNNQAQYYGDNVDAKLQMMDMRSALAEARTAAAHAKMGAPIQLVDRDGNAVLATPVMGADGNVTFKRADMGGLSFAKTPHPRPDIPYDKWVAANAGLESSVPGPDGRKLKIGDPRMGVDRAMDEYLRVTQGHGASGGAPVTPPPAERGASKAPSTPTAQTPSTGAMVPPVMRSPDALAAPLRTMNAAELTSIRPGHPAYMAAQAEMARRAASGLTPDGVPREGMPVGRYYDATQ